MNFSDESYVRLYTRDTTSWLRLGWDGQCIVSLMLRKVDRAGTLDLDGLEPWEAVMLQLKCPEQAARDGMAAALRVGVFQIVGDRLVIPNFHEAQTCSKSDRLRQRESRAARPKGPPAPPDLPGPSSDPPPVTDRDNESQNVTVGHELSGDVTSGHSQLSLAQPSSAQQRGERACAPPPDNANGVAPRSHPALPVALAPGQAREPSSTHIAAFDATFGAEAFRRQIRPTPTLSSGQKREFAKRALQHSDGTGLDFEVAALELVRQAFDDSATLNCKVVFALGECIPGRPAQPRGGGRRIEPSPVPTAEDFKNTAPSIAEQRARIRAGG